MVSVPFEERVPEDEVRTRDAAEYDVSICGDGAAGGGGSSGEEGVEKAGDQEVVIVIVVERIADGSTVLLLSLVWESPLLKGNSPAEDKEPPGEEISLVVC
ncbi:hypothetical protein Droror1_Dr00006429 [Drosera rotundifolia]